MERTVTDSISKLFLIAAWFLIIAMFMGCAPEAPADKEDAPDETVVAQLTEANETDSAQNAETTDTGYKRQGGMKKGTEFVRLGKGINIGNALEAPKGMCWGVEMTEDYFDYIKDAGFDTVRLPVRFSAYTQGEDFTLEEEFMQKLDFYIDYALDRDLNIILDFHHFEEIMKEPLESKEELIMVWRQLGKRYEDYPNNLIFEVLNEPKDNLSGEILNEILREAVAAIRETNPTRMVIIGPERYNSIEGLVNLEIPEDDNLVVTVHYYVPNDFAFQGNIYHKGYEDLHSITWTATEEQMAKLRGDFLTAKRWADENNVDIFLGEFGIVKTVPVQYRSAWTEAVTDVAEEFGFSWSYWELSSHFGIFDDETREWDTELLRVLIE